MLLIIQRAARDCNCFLYALHYAGNFDVVQSRSRVGKRRRNHESIDRVERVDLRRSSRVASAERLDWQLPPIEGQQSSHDVDCRLHSANYRVLLELSQTEEGLYCVLPLYDALNFMFPDPSLNDPVSGRHVSRPRMRGSCHVTPMQIREMHAISVIPDVRE